MRRLYKPNAARAVPNKARDAGSGTSGGPEPQLGVPGMQAVPGWLNSLGMVPKVNVTVLIVVLDIIPESETTNVPVWLIYGECVPLVIELFALV